METFENALENAQEELRNVSLYLCDGNAQEAEELLKRTNEIATKYQHNKDTKKWLIGIMKYTFLEQVKERLVRTDSIINNLKT